MVNLNICPVCGYGMEVPPSDYSICSSCGTEFDPLMTKDSYADLKKSWIANGPTWWSTFNDKPKDWNPWEQLKALELNAIGTQPTLYVSYSFMNGNNSTDPPITTHRHSRRVPVAAGNSANSMDDYWSFGVLGKIANY
jgi:hypothetical protein